MPTIPKIKFTESYATEDDGAEDVKKIGFVSQKTEKGKLSMDPMVGSSWKSKDYSNPMEEAILLVGKSMAMPEATSEGLSPQAARVGQMKLDSPSQ